MPAQIKSITGGLNKLQRDSMGDTGSGNPADGQLPGHLMQQTPNFYEFPQNQGKGERAACGSDIGMGNMAGNSYENTPANIMNRFSPKVSLGQDINNVFPGSQGHGTHGSHSHTGHGHSS